MTDKEQPKWMAALTEEEIDLVEFARAYSRRQVPGYSDGRKAKFVKLVDHLADRLDKLEEKGK